MMCNRRWSSLGEPEISSESWTGRPRWAGSLIDVLKRWVESRLFPGFECELCIGQEACQGCYCAYYGAIAPNTPPGPIREWLQRRFEEPLTFTYDRVEIVL